MCIALQAAVNAQRSTIATTPFTEGLWLDMTDGGCAPVTLQVLSSELTDNLREQRRDLQASTRWRRGTAC